MPFFPRGFPSSAGFSVDGAPLARLTFHVLHYYSDIQDGAHVAVTLRAAVPDGLPTAHSVRKVGYLWKQLGSAASMSSGAGCVAHSPTL